MPVHPAPANDLQDSGLSKPEPPHPWPDPLPDPFPPEPPPPVPDPPDPGPPPIPTARQRGVLGAAALVLICFFLPWLQVSCPGIRDAASGFDLARSGDRALWLIPLFMLTTLLMGFTAVVWEQGRTMFVLVGLIGGSVSAHLMYRQRSHTGYSSGLIETHWTVWFWLGLVSSLGVAIASLLYYSRRARSP